MDEGQGSTRRRAARRARAQGRDAADEEAAEVILHLVLFTPRADLSETDQDRLAEALERALTSIPSVSSYRVGRRIRTGAAYDALGPAFDYCAAIEFASLDGLAEYLRHPSHVELGQLFYTASGEAFAGDFEAVSSSPAAALREWARIG
jgi:hypothetical protein